ncbi:MAG: MgtC/SapB family protein [Sphingobacteriales bacterium]|nr:MgtC/SapB family protein [Sphingobacteriales bacterium]MBI3717882.1 MgtC/SapB family protein [Sphingobacteriales bacterium]
MMDFSYIDLIKIALAFALGAVLGVEREYRSKPAGFRTMIMITLGACLFTIISYKVDAAAPDRIAANIITGIGFIGAGVIFKEGLKVSGLTTAATIWVAAAIGMAIGYGAFYLAAILTAVVLGTLLILSKLEEVLDRLHQIKVYQISISLKKYSIAQLEEELTKMKLDYLRFKISKESEEVVTVSYKIESKQSGYENLNNFLLSSDSIKGFEV